MPNLPIRNLGAVGVLTDPDAFNLPINAFTRAKNVRFDQGDVVRSPCFRDVETVTGFNPIFMTSILDVGNFDKVIIVADDFDIYELANGTISLDYSPSASTATSSVTSTSLANVTYLNRSDLAPHYRTPAMSNFATLVNWPSGFTCESLRSFGDFLIALNTTEGGSTFPSRVRFSNIALANNAPDSWDASDTTKSAGFNDLSQMGTPIVDGATLGSNFIVYSSDQVWQMEFVGGTFIFNFRKLFQDRGIINQNCVVEVSGKHYVFDADDIYIHDGLSDQSLVDGRIRDYIYSGIDTGSLDRCFVQYDPVRQDIYFSYKSSDDMAEFTNGDGCNRAAVYNIQSNTWSFMDLPNVFAGTVANINTVATYATVAAGLTYATSGGTYASQSSGFDQHALMLSRSSATDGLSSHNVFALDGINENTSLSGTINTEANKPIKLERIGIDLDQEAQLPLASYKNIIKMVPQFSTVATDKTFLVSMGASSLSSEVPAYETAVTLDMSTDYKVDSRSSGRYLSYKVETSDNKDFTVSGFDFDVVATGRR